MRRLVTVAMLAVTAPSAGPALAASANDTGQPAARGKIIFDKWCAPCHAPNPKLAGTLALQTKYQGNTPAALEQRTDLTPEIVSTFVRNGVAWMAPFRKTEITDPELADLGAYLAKRPAGKKGRGK